MGLKLLFILVILLGFFACKKNQNFTTDRSYIKEVLKDFLSNKEGSNLNRQNIEGLLYDIQDKETTRGRAVHIGDQIFLTANHVLIADDMQIVHQSLRGELPPNEGIFEILHRDIEYDLALLRAGIANPGKKALHRLRQIPLKQGDMVSQHLYFTGPKKNKEFILEYDGVDYYDNVKIVKNLGRFVFSEGSLIFEKQGSVWPFHEDFFKALGMNQGLARINKKTQAFTSIPVFPGESGSGVYFRKASGQYSLTAITIIAWAADFEIQTPGHPLGYETVQQSSNFVVKPEIIVNFIQSYLNRQQLPIQK